jgi:hypothetical protein
MNAAHKLTAVAFLGLGVLGAVAIVGAFAGLTLLAIAEHADANLADIDELIERTLAWGDAWGDAA